MASNTVAVRLPEDVLEQLQRKAEGENKKVSDVVRELIVTGLEEKKTGISSEHERLIIEYLDGFGGFLHGIFVQATMAHYFSRMSTSYSLDIESLMRTADIVESEEKKARLATFDKGALDQAMQIWAQIMVREEANKKPQSKS